MRRVPAPPSWRARVGGEELEEGDGVPSYGLGPTSWSRAGTLKQEHSCPVPVPSSHLGPPAGPSTNDLCSAGLMAAGQKVKLYSLIFHP